MRILQAKVSINSDNYQCKTAVEPSPEMSNMSNHQKSFTQLLEELELLRVKNDEMKKLEAQHQKSKEIVQKVQAEKQQYLDIAAVIFIVIDVDEKITLLNKKGCEILEYTEEEVLGKNWFDTCVPQRERNHVRAIFQQLMQGEIEPVENAETPVVTRSGREKIIAWHNTVIRDDNGEVVATLSSGEEVTERKRFEAALRESEEKYRTLVDNALVGIYKTSINGELLYANDALVKILGYKSRQDMMPQNVVMTYKDPDVRNIMLKELRETGKVEEFEIEIITHTGQEKTVLISSFLENDAINGMFMDITERKRIEREKDQQQAEQLQSEKMEVMGAVAEKAARDFSSLIGTIQENARQAIECLEQNHPAAGPLRNIQMGGARAASLTQQLLLVKGRQHNEEERFNSGEMIAAMMSDIDRITGQEIVVRTEIEPGSWDLLGDREEIELMIMNLIVNGREAMPDGGILQIHLKNKVVTEADCGTVEDARPGSFVQISVMDEGPGIGPEVIPHIFDPFFTTKDEGESSGLGLSVVYGIAKQHGGWVNISSRHNAGSSFTIHLPAVTS